MAVSFEGEIPLDLSRGLRRSPLGRIIDDHFIFSVPTTGARLVRISRRLVPGMDAVNSEFPNFRYELYKEVPHFATATELINTVSMDDYPDLSVASHYIAGYFEREINHVWEAGVRKVYLGRRLLAVLMVISGITAGVGVDSVEEAVVVKTEDIEEIRAVLSHGTIELLRLLFGVRAARVEDSNSLIKMAAGPAGSIWVTMVSKIGTTRAYLYDVINKDLKHKWTSALEEGHRKAVGLVPKVDEIMGHPDVDMRVLTVEEMEQALSTDVDTLLPVLRDNNWAKVACRNGEIRLVEMANEAIVRPGQYKFEARTSLEVKIYVRSSLDNNALVEVLKQWAYEGSSAVLREGVRVAVWHTCVDPDNLLSILLTALKAGANVDELRLVYVLSGLSCTADAAQRGVVPPLDDSPGAKADYVDRLLSAFPLLCSSGVPRASKAIVNWSNAMKMAFWGGGDEIKMHQFSEEGINYKPAGSFTASVGYSVDGSVLLNTLGAEEHKMKMAGQTIIKDSRQAKGASLQVFASGKASGAMPRAAVGFASGTDQAAIGARQDALGKPVLVITRVPMEEPLMMEVRDGTVKTTGETCAAVFNRLTGRTKDDLGGLIDMFAELFGSPERLGSSLRMHRDVADQAVYNANEDGARWLFDLSDEYCRD